MIIILLISFTCVFIICITMDIPAVSRGSGHQCWFVVRAQRCLDPACSTVRCGEL